MYCDLVKLLVLFRNTKWVYEQTFWSESPVNDTKYILWQNFFHDNTFQQTKFKYPHLNRFRTNKNKGQPQPPTSMSGFPTPRTDLGAPGLSPCGLPTQFDFFDSLLLGSVSTRFAESGFRSDLALAEVWSVFWSFETRALLQWFSHGAESCSKLLETFRFRFEAFSLGAGCGRSTIEVSRESLVSPGGRALGWTDILISTKQTSWKFEQVSYYFLRRATNSLNEWLVIAEMVNGYYANHVKWSLKH